MILLFTDFGLEGPYLGQVKAVLAAAAPAVPVIDLLSDAPPFDPGTAAYLLAALAEACPAGSVLLAVVDPGVGGPRAPIAVRAGGRWFVGPDNGLLAVAARRDPEAQAWEITWRPAALSASFHGRDLFAPVAARLAKGEPPPGGPRAVDLLVGAVWPPDLAQIVYCDRFGNLMTGLRATALGPDQGLRAGGHRLPRARTFSDLAPGEAFCYENANGLIEIAVNQGRADALLGLAVGDPVQIPPTT